MTKYNYKSVLICLLAGTLFTEVSAQQEPKGSDFSTDPIRVVRTYEAILADALKVSPVPELPTLQTARKELSYKTINRMAPTAVELAPLTPLRALPEPPSPIGIGHLRIGGGNYNTPFADLRLMNRRDPKFEYGLTMKHFSSSSDLRVDTSQFNHANLSDNLIGVHGKRYLNKMYLHAEFAYERNVRHFYGFHQPIDIPRDSIRQVFNQFSGSVGLSSFQVEADQIEYKSKFSFYSFGDRYGQQENNLRLDGGFMVRYDENRLDFDFAIDYTNFNTVGDISNNRTLIYFQPRYNLQKTDLLINAGFNLAMEASTGVSQFRIYPHLDVNYLINDVYMVAYGGITGNTHRVGYRDMIQTNPFLGTGLDIRNRNERVHVFAGLKGSFDELTAYNVMLGFQRQEQAMFFVNDLMDPSRLLPLYDSSTNIFGLRFEVNRKFSERYEMHVKADLRRYNLENLEAPFMQPTTAIRIGGAYYLQKRIKFMAEAIMFNGVSYIDPAIDPTAPANVARLNGVFDLNVGVQYDYADKWGFFLNLNNVTSARYFRWFNYPTFGFNVLGGLNIRF